MVVGYLQKSTSFEIWTYDVLSLDRRNVLYTTYLRNDTKFNLWRFPGSSVFFHEFVPVFEKIPKTISWHYVNVTKLANFQISPTLCHLINKIPTTSTHFSYSIEHHARQSTSSKPYRLHNRAAQRNKFAFFSFLHPTRQQKSQQIGNRCRVRVIMDEAELIINKIRPAQTRQFHRTWTFHANSSLFFNVIFLLACNSW